jgi:hypothetical protein
MRRIATLLALTVIGLSSHESRAAVSFAAGNQSVAPGGSLGVPVSVGDFVDVTSFQFVLRWDKDILQFVSVNFAGSPLPGLDSSNFGTDGTADGELRVSWDFLPTTLVGTPTAFSVNYAALGGIGEQTPVSFEGVQGFPIEVTVNFAAVTPEFSIGGVSVVPEPINVALGAFAGVFAVGTTVSWFLKRRSPPASS